MPAPETADLHDKACLYAYYDRDDNGDVRVSSVQEIDCRWQIRKREMLDAQGNRVRIDAEAAVDREIALGSILWKGEREDLPDTPEDLYQVFDYREATDVKGRNTRRVVLLIRYSDELPEVV